MAQAEAEEAPPADVLAHPLVPGNVPEPITEAGELASLVEHVRESGCFAYDTEFIGEETYYPRFCLVQIATASRVALVDPLAGLDLTSIWELIADPDVETIVHAGAQDLEPVVRHLDAPPARVFDTQIAAGFLDWPYPLGLRQIVVKILNVHLPKALTFTRWDKRPLSVVHARYAADDVRYLPAVRASLRERLDAAGHLAWAEEECAALTDVSRYRFDPDTRVARMTSNRSLKPKQLAALRELVVFRDQASRTLDTPPQTLLRDDVLVRVVKERARTPEALADVKGMPTPLVDRHGREILAVLARAEAGESVRVAAPPAETPVDRVRIDSLWSLVCCYCRAGGIDPSLVASRRAVARSYFAAKKREERPTASWATGWRRAFIGDFLDTLLAGDAAIRFTWKGGRLASDARD